MATPVPDTKVIHGVFTQPGLPTFEGRTKGNMIKVLRAFLVDGWYENPILSITYDAETGEAEVTFAEQHQYLRDQVIDVTGASPSDYNGRWKVASVTDFTLRFLLATVPTGDSSGEGMVCRCAPAGWTIPHINASEDIAIFKNSVGKSFQVWNDEATSGSGGYSHINSTATYYQGAKIRAVRDYTDTTDGVEYCGAYYTPIHDTDDDENFGTGASIPYEFVADDQGVYLIWKHANISGRRCWTMLYFGMTSHPGKGDKVFLACGVSYGSASTYHTSYHCSNLGYMSGEDSHEKRIEFTDDGDNQSCGAWAGLGSQAGRGPFSFPTAEGELLYVDKVELHSGGQFHGYMPGLGFPLHNNPLATHAVFTGPDGKRWWALKVAAAGENSQPDYDLTCEFFFDITGPWR